MPRNTTEQVQEQTETQVRSEGNSRRRFNYANVMSTIAVFVALGGTGYAAAKINGANIKDRTVSGQKLKRGAVGSSELGKKAVIARAKLATNADHAKTADSTSHLLVPGKGKTSKATARAAGDAPAPCDTGSLVKLGANEECVMFEKTPFTVTAKCEDKGNDVISAQMNVTSTEDGWYGGTEQGAHTAGQSVSLNSFDSVNSRSAFTVPSSLQAPSGAALQISAVEIDIKRLAACTFTANAIG